MQARTIYGDIHIGSGSPRRSEPPPRQLPAVPANFTGRAGELAVLERLASESSAVHGLAVAVIVGPGGLGKTALAARWLHGAARRYPGGVLSADLGGHQLADAARPGDVLERFLRVMGVVPESIPGALQEQAALFRSVTAGRRVAVFLDNAASAAQARVLLPGPGPGAGHKRDAARGPGDPVPAGDLGLPSLVLVTSRWRIAGLAVDGARFVELDPLEEASAAELFGRVTGADRTAEEEASREVVRLCGGMPLALCVAGARLAAHPRWPVSRIARDLADGRARLSALSLADDLSVRAALDTSYRALPDQVGRAYRTVALIPGPDFPGDLAAAAMDDEHGQDLLDELADASLLAETPDGRYRMHDLILLHAREQEGPGLPGGAHGVITRSVDWYLREAVAADRVVLPGRWRLGPLYADAGSAPPAYSGVAGALEWTESYLPGLVAAVRAAHDAGLHPQAWQLCEALWGTFAFRKHYPAWLESHEIGLSSARACGDRRAEAQMHIQLGAAHRSMRELATAASHFSRALELFREEGHQLGEASALEQLGVVQLRSNRYDEAVSSFTKALGIHQAIGRPRGIALMNLNIGQALAASGRQDEAAGYFRMAAGQFESINESYHRARALTALGAALTGSGRALDAGEPLLAALALTRELGASYDRAHAHIRLADLADVLGQPTRAVRHLEQALTLFTEVGAASHADGVRARLAGPSSGDAERPPG